MCLCVFYFIYVSTAVQGEIQFCVLDEADLMLQMGFQEPVERIFQDMPENKQTTLWSATMPREFDRVLCVCVLQARGAS